MGDVTFDASGALRRFSNKVTRFPGVADVAVQAYRKEMAEKLLDLVRQKASGRPGPNIVTGAYVSRFYVEETSSKSSRVTNNSPQTHRLEYGFVGVDSAGRNYHQGPFPHFRPALQEIRGPYLAGMPKVVIDAWRSM